MPKSPDLHPNRIDHPRWPKCQDWPAWLELQPVRKGSTFVRLNATSAIKWSLSRRRFPD